MHGEKLIYTIKMHDQSTQKKKKKKKEKNKLQAIKISGCFKSEKP